MGRPITQERAIGATSQFTGTEFSIQPASADPGAFLQVREVNLKMGTESTERRLFRLHADQ